MHLLKVLAFEEQLINWVIIFFSVNRNKLKILGIKTKRVLSTLDKKMYC